MKKLKIAAMGVEHRHIFGQLEGMLNLDCEYIVINKNYNY